MKPVCRAILLLALITASNTDATAQRTAPIGAMSRTGSIRAAQAVSPSMTSAEPEIIAVEELPSAVVLQPGPRDPASSFSEPLEGFHAEVPPNDVPLEPPLLGSSGEWFRAGRWYTQLDSLVLHRDRPNSVIIGRDNSSEQSIADFGESLGLAAGARLTLGRFLGRDELNRDRMLEFSYLGVGEFDAQDAIESLAAGQLFVPFAPSLPGFTGADTFDAQYESRLTSAEANFRIRRRPGRDAIVASPDGTWTRRFQPDRLPSLLVGVRGISVDEEFDFLSRRHGVAPSDFRGDYLSDTDNLLLGLQVGGDVIEQREEWHWGVRGKFGLLANFAEAHTQILIDTAAPPVTIEQQAEETEAALLGEFGLFAGYQLTPNAAIRAGYDFLIVGGLALAPQQVRELTVQPEIDTSGTIVYQGLSVGLDIVW